MKSVILIVGLALVVGATALLAGDAVVPQKSAAVSFRSVVTANGPVLYPYSIAAGDLTHNGIPDLAVVGVEEPALLHGLGKGNGRFDRWSDTGNAGDAPDFVIFADVDLDGNLDAVSADGDEPFVTVAFGDGKGNFNHGVQPRTGRGYDTQEVAVADLNGDGIPDLVGTSIGAAGSPGGIFILLGKGNRTFAKAVNISSGGHKPNGIAVGDLNHDGIPDLVVANSLSSSGPGNVAVLLGKGDGTFEKPVRYQAGVYSPWQVVLGDFNGDGNLDLAVLTIDGDDEDKIYVLLGNGDGTFGKAKAYRSGMYPGSIAVADFNGDGILDLAVANVTGPKPSHISILLGNGNGTFQPPIAFPVGVNPASLITADFNHDGKPDLAALTGSSGITVLLNTTPFPTQPASH
ncbi:MAG TPA: VCBS repeat-containing protein [Terriglobales bacterium]|nr:VCBS repeat-containing protein [Terriglobales bacterium]